MRTIAIINTSDVDINGNIVEMLKDNEIVVFRGGNSKFSPSGNVKVVDIPEEIVTSGSKTRNFVLKHFLYNEFHDFLHVLEDNIQIYNDPSIFVSEIEKMMRKIQVKSWFNTVTDVCNYTFKIYNPRFSVAIDEEPLKKVYDKTIYWTSHANPGWSCYDYENIAIEEIEFDEKFTIPMYYIIKFLAERRNHKKNGELYYMNYYPTIMEERNVFRSIEIKAPHVEIQENPQTESQIFNAMGINHDPDVNVEKVMDDLIEVLKCQV